MDNFLNKTNIELKSRIDAFNKAHSEGIVKSIQNIYLKNKHTISCTDINYCNSYVDLKSDCPDYLDLVMYEKQLRSEDFDY